MRFKAEQGRQTRHGERVDVQVVLSFRVEPQARTNRHTILFMVAPDERGKARSPGT